MKYTDELKEVYEFAKAAHEGQFRDFSGKPYITHPLRVAEELYKLGYDHNMLAAALLHDTVEDTDVFLDQVRTRFGDEIANLVDWVTEPAKKEGRYETTPKYTRKAEFLRHLEKAPIKAKTLKCADIADNTRDFIKHWERNTGRAERFYFAKMDMLTRLIGADPIMKQRAANELDKLRLLVLPSKQ